MIRIKYSNAYKFGYYICKSCFANRCCCKNGCTHTPRMKCEQCNNSFCDYHSIEHKIAASLTVSCSDIGFDYHKN